jgi:hypothetical protein
MVKILLRVLLAVVILAIVAGVVAWLMIDPLAKAAVENGAGYALGVETTLDDIDVGLLGGRVRMDGLKIANPEGFSDGFVMTSGRFELEISPASLLSDTVRVRKFELDGLGLNVEQRLGGSNVGKVIENVRRFESKDPDQRDPDTKGGKKVRADRLLIRNVEATFHLLPETGAVEPITVKVPTIELTDVASDEGGVVVAELVARIVPAVVAAVIEQGRGELPGDFRQGLDKKLRDLTGQMGGDVRRLVGKARDTAGRGVKEATSKAGEAAKNFLEGLGGGRENEGP